MATKIDFQDTNSPHTRPALFADDLWYSPIIPQLQMDIQGYLDEARPTVPPDQLKSLIVPHTGYILGGSVSAAAYVHLSPGDFDTVILLGPNQKPAKTTPPSTDNPLTTLQADKWQTPLGSMPVDTALVSRLQADIDIKMLTMDEEYSLEIQLPFLQMSLKSGHLLPLMLQPTATELARPLAEALAKHWTDRTLLIAISNLSRHYDDPTARQIDARTRQLILDFAVDDLIDYAQENDDPERPYLTAPATVATSLHLSRLLGQPQATWLNYATTAEFIPSRQEQVIGYAAIALS